MRRVGAAAFLAVNVALSACTPTSAPSSSAEASRTDAPPSPSAGRTTSPPIVSPSPSPTGATLALGDALPLCKVAAPDASDTVTFVASGHAWALNPAGTHLTCLFAVEDVGPFEWGPLGDRALVGGFEVKGVADGPSVAATDTPFMTISWSRPTGKAIVYAPADGTSLKKLHMDGATTEDVSPLPSSTYLSVAYHPSGEAFAFAVEQAGVESIWISSNVGEKPGRLVFSEEGTRFGAMGFDNDGKHLFYAAQHADNHAELHSIDVTDPSKAPVVWDGPIGPTVLDIRPGLRTGTVAWSTGISCADSVAMAQTPAGTVAALPDADEPTRAVGWLGATQLLVAAGACDGPLELSVVDVSIGSIAPLVSGVDAAAVRTPVPTPPAPLPQGTVTEGSGFS